MKWRANKKEDTLLDRRTFLSKGTAAASFIAAGGLTKGFAGPLQKAPAQNASGAVVEMAAGKVRGFTQDGVYIFRGLPYGASTAGAGRFMPAAKPQPWPGIREATEFGLRAPQVNPALIPEWQILDRTEPMGEDCLCLNVWTSSPGSAQKKPVMVWLHGGGMMDGSAGWYGYDGLQLAKKHDVVMVGVNHRLNVFGFLYLAEVGGEKYAQASNVGMLDIVAALEWVRDNISAFGGDPNRVTVFGQSGGGSKATTLMAMPAAKGLFHRAIAQSGFAMTAIPHDAATKSAELFLSKLGVKGNQIDQLQKMPMKRLLETMRTTQGLRLGPVVDGHSLLRNQFDPTAPEISADIPLIVGSVETEVTFRNNTTYEPLTNEGLRNNVKELLRADDASVDRVIATYRKGRPKASNLDLSLIIASDNWTHINAITVAERKFALGKAPTYMYYFTWRTPVRDGRLRTPHTLDIPFVMDNVDGCQSITGNGKDRYVLATKMSNAWVAFAASGNPNHQGLANWPAYNPTQRATMIFDNDTGVVNDPYGQERVAVLSIGRSSN